MKTKAFSRMLALVLALVTVISLAAPAFAASYDYTVSDGDHYSVHVGDILYLRNPDSNYEMTFSDYYWGVVTENKTGGIKLTDNNRNAVVEATQAGTVQMYSELTGSIPKTNYGKRYNSSKKEWETYTYTTYHSKTYKNYFTITIYDENPPAVESLPDTVFAAEGSTAKVTVKATTGTGTSLRYQWYYANAGSSTFSKASVTSKTYSVTMNDDRNGRKIYCVVTDGNGKKTKSETVTLKMAVPVKITTQPKSVTVTAGTTAKTTINATGQGKLKYTWYVKDTDAEKFTKSSLTTATYSVKMTPSVHGRKVYCVVSDSYGQKVKTNTVTLKMNSTLGIYSQPSNSKALAGQTATTTVKAYGDGNLTYTWYVKDPGQDSFVKSSLTSNTYKVTMKSSNNGRKVYCVVKDSAGKKVTSNTVTLTTVPKLMITTQPQSTKVAEGSNATVSVKITGGSGVKYQWYIASAGSSSFSKSSITKATYSTQMNDSRNGRKVYCVITDQCGQKVKSNTVTLSQAKPLTIKTQPASVKVAGGKKASTTVSATGDGTLKYTWYIKNAGGSKFSKSSITSATYATTMKDSVNGREAYCVVTDNYGQKATTETVTLSQAQKLVITQQPKDIYYDDIESYDCYADGEKPLTYTWYRRKAGGNFEVCKTDETRASFSYYLLPCNVVSAYKGGEVYCVVSDEYGQSVKSRVAKISETQ